MYGIKSKTAKLIIPAALAFAIAGFAAPAQADGKYYGGHGKYGKSGHYKAKKFKRAYKQGYKQGYRKGYRKGSKYGHGHGHGHKPKARYAYKPKHGYKKYGHKKYGYKSGYKYGHGYAPNRKYWRKHGNHGVTIQVWKPLGPPPTYRPHRVRAACHPVVGHGSDHFGRRAKFGGTMCYDRYGYGYVVAGSRYVIRYY